MQEDILEVLMILLLLLGTIALVDVPLVRFRVHTSTRVLLLTMADAVQYDSMKLLCAIVKVLILPVQYARTCRRVT